MLLNTTFITGILFSYYEKNYQCNDLSNYTERKKLRGE